MAKAWYVISPTIHPASSGRGMRQSARIAKSVLACALSLLAGCVQTPQDALKLSPSSLAEREIQSRIYEQIDEAQILAASVAVMQDLGVKITETDPDLGLVVGEKYRDATEPTQLIGAFIIALIGGGSAPVDDRQLIRFSLITRSDSGRRDSRRWLVRLSLQRTIWASNNRVTRAEPLLDAEIFRDFFERLDKAIFLEVQS